MIHQVVPDLDPDDGIHDVACKCVVKSAMIWDQVEKAGLPNVRGVWCMEFGGGRLFNVIRGARGLNYGNYSYIEVFPEGGQRFMPPVNLLPGTGHPPPGTRSPP